MKPIHHAQITAHRYGGQWSDWIRAHNFFDQSKKQHASVQHRVFLHSDFGLELSVQILGETLTSQSKEISIQTRDLATDHLVEDLGSVVPLTRYLELLDHAMVARRKRPLKKFELVRESPTDGLARLWGGIPSDYEPLVQFFDSARTFAPGFEEAAGLILHNTFGIFLAEERFGVAMYLSRSADDDGMQRERMISTRSAAEDLVQARFGYIPTAAEVAARTRLKLWMCGNEVRPSLRRRHEAERRRQAAPVTPVPTTTISTCSEIHRND